MEFILVSACLLGQPVRYHGGSAPYESTLLKRWEQEGRIVAICPEVAGGLPIPRPPSEIALAAGGANVLAGTAIVVEKTGQDVTREFVLGARQALAIARQRGIRLAILKEGSPSCGSGYTHDGQFRGSHIPLPGVTAALLQQEGLRVFSEAQLDAAERYLRGLEGKTSSEA